MGSRSHLKIMNRSSGALWCVIAGLVFMGTALPLCSAESHWVRHVIHEGEQSMTAVAGDFTGDDVPDVISDSGAMTRLFVPKALAPSSDELRSARVIRVRAIF